jgi:predicted DNA-binding transcriptional regulator AlpA
MKIDLTKFGQLPDDALISMATVAAVCGVGISTAWRYAAHDKTFPPAIKLSKRCTRRRLGDIRAYIAAKGV